MIMKCEYIAICKDTVMTYITVVFWHSS